MGRLCREVAGNLDVVSDFSGLENLSILFAGDVSFLLCNSGRLSLPLRLVPGVSDTLNAKRLQSLHRGSAQQWP